MPMSCFETANGILGFDVRRRWKQLEVEHASHWIQFAARPLGGPTCPWNLVWLSQASCPNKTFIFLTTLDLHHISLVCWRYEIYEIVSPRRVSCRVMTLPNGNGSDASVLHFDAAGVPRGGAAECACYQPPKPRLGGVDRWHGLDGRVIPWKTLYWVVVTSADDKILCQIVVCLYGERPTWAAPMTLTYWCIFWHFA